METITSPYLHRAELWLFITTLMYFLMNGAQIFETAVIVPKWTAAPPESFAWLNDKNGSSLKTFWIVIHSLHEITFILAIVFCWKLDPVRNWLLILFVAHMAIRVWTLAYFAPNIIQFQKLAEAKDLAADLISRASLWKTLNYVRVAAFILVSLALVPLCIRLASLRA